MNTKIKMGQFLKELRLKNKLTQEGLADKITDAFLPPITNVAIGAWEKGKSIPSLEYLVFLSELYGVTVDDILNGEHTTKIDYYKKYPVLDKNYLMNCTPKELKEIPIFDIYTDQMGLIRNNLKKLVVKYAKNNISNTEKEELSFLIVNCVVDGQECWEELPSFLSEIKNESSNEIWWKFNSLYSLISPFCVWPNIICDGEYEAKEVQKRFDLYEEWEKDLVLAYFTFNTPMISYSSPYGKGLFDRFKKRFGRDFDYENEWKRTIKFCIEHGARINNAYYPFKKGTAKEVSTIDLIEEAYKGRYKLLTVRSEKMQETRFYKVPNTERNRLIANYSYLIYKIYLVGYSIEDAISLILNNDTVPENLVEKFKDRELNELLDDPHFKNEKLKYYEPYFLDQWNRYKSEEKKLLMDRDNYELMSEDLKNGAEVTTSLVLEDAFELSLDGLFDHVQFINYDISYKDFLSMRDEALTQKLMEEIDSLDLNYMFLTYFSHKE